MLVAGVFGIEVQRTVLFRRYIVVDYRGGDDGFLGAGSKLCPESAVRVVVEEGEFQTELIGVASGNID